MVSPLINAVPAAAARSRHRYILALAAAVIAAPVGAAEPAGSAAPDQSRTSAADSAAAVELAQANAATEAVDEVVVNSVQRAAQQLQDVPESISAVTGEELQRFETNSFQNILTKIGNVRWAGASSQRHPLHTSLTIRGLGYFKAGAGGLDPGVGVSVDGISYAYSTLAAGASFYDLESVQVSRGPQGTLGGLNANLGTISFITKAPSSEDEAEASVTYGQRNTLILKAVAGGSVVDGLLAYRATLFRESADGAFENDFNKTQSFGNRDRTIGKLQFLLTPGDSFRARVGVDFTPKGGELDGGTSFGLWARPTPAFYDTLREDGSRIPVDPTTTPEGRLARRWFQQQSGYQYLDGDRVNISGTYPIYNRQRGAFADLSGEIAGGTLSSLTAWRDLFFYWNGKSTEDRTIFDIVAIPTAADQTLRQFSQELRFNARLGNVEYVVGAYYLDKSLDAASMNRFGSDAGAYYANQTQYTALDADVSGRSLLLNAADRLLLRSPVRTDGESLAGFANLKWDLGEALTLATGLRVSDERRTQTSSRSIVDNGFGAELNPASVNNVTLNGFRSYSSNGTNGASYLAGDLAPGNTAEQLALADLVANKYFGVPRYADLSAAQRRQVALAKSIRQARLGALSQPTTADPFDDVLIGGHFSPSYRLNETYTAYLSYQHGEKAGVAQIVGATVNGGVSVPVDKERTDAYEIGLKSLFLDGALAVNTSLFLQNIKDYIQPVLFYDEAQTLVQNNGVAVYTEGLGNVPKVRSKGVELDVTYSVGYTVARVAGAYTDARYIEFPNLAKPPELGGTSTPYYDVSGRRLPGAAKLTFNVSLDHARPVFDNKELHIGANYNYTGSNLTEPTLSRYAKQDGYGLTDLLIGLGRQDHKFDATLIVRNVFDVDYGSDFNWNSYAPSEPRWVGVNFSSKFR